MNVFDDLRHALRSLRARALLLIGQTALTTQLLIGARLLGRNCLALLAIDPGFASAGAVSLQVSQPGTRDAAIAAASARRYSELMTAFACLLGVNAVGGVSGLPLTDGGFCDGNVTSLEKAGDDHV